MNFDYASSDWEIDSSDFYEKISSFNSLESLNFPHIAFDVFSYEKLCELCEKSFAFDIEHLVMVYDNVTNDRDGFFGIRDLCELKTIIDSRFMVFDGKEHRIICVCVEEMKKFEGCFTGTIISNGKGNLFCELLCDTVDNRELTRVSNIHNCFEYIKYQDYELAECTNFIKYRIIKQYLDQCLIIKGYFEFSYCKLRSKKEVLFCHYSKTEQYQINDYVGEIDFNNYVRARLLRSLI